MEKIGLPPSCASVEWNCPVHHRESLVINPRQAGQVVHAFHTLIVAASRESAAKKSRGKRNAAANYCGRICGALTRRRYKADIRSRPVYTFMDLPRRKPTRVWPLSEANSTARLEGAPI